MSSQYNQLLENIVGIDERYYSKQWKIRQLDEYFTDNINNLTREEEQELSTKLEYPYFNSDRYIYKPEKDSTRQDFQYGLLPKYQQYRYNPELSLFNDLQPGELRRKYRNGLVEKYLPGGKTEIHYPSGKVEKYSPYNDNNINNNRINNLLFEIENLRRN